MQRSPAALPEGGSYGLCWEGPHGACAMVAPGAVSEGKVSGRPRKGEGGQHAVSRRGGFQKTASEETLLFIQYPQGAGHCDRA